jgi:hypothetical protein
MTKAIFAILAVLAAVNVAQASDSDDDLDEFFQRERDALGGDPGGDEDYQVVYDRNYVQEGRIHIYERAPEMRYERRPVETYDVQCGQCEVRRVPRGKRYIIQRERSRVNWDPLLSDNAQHVFIE